MCLLGFTETNNEFVGEILNVEHKKMYDKVALIVTRHLCLSLVKL